jgi:cysteine desulfurase
VGPRVYLDHAATSPLRPASRAAVVEALDIFGNPSSVHAEGRAARAMLEAARRAIRAAIGAAGTGEFVFTSGATEANATALLSHARQSGAIVASSVEHPSILAQPGVETLPVDASGRLDLVALEARLALGDVALVVLMLANNETGVVQPVADAARLAHAAGARLHADAVQALGRIAVDVDALGCDSLALSAHKLGGPKGSGALWLRDPDATVPLLQGGGQEGRRRAGTENTAGIAGFAAAVTAVMAEAPTRLAELRLALEEDARAIAPDAVVIAEAAERLPHIAAIALPGVPAATQVMALDLAGVAVSAGAACSSGKVARSHVLEAMGTPGELADCTIRVSLGWTTTKADIARLLEAWGGLAERRPRAAARQIGASRSRNALRSPPIWPT